MSVFRVVFLGTPQFAVPALRVLLDDPHFSVVAVVTQPDRPAGRNLQLRASPIKELALTHGLTVWTPENVNNPDFIEQLADLHADTAVVVAYGQLMRQPFLDVFPLGVVNLHASLLPRWRGAAPIQRALMAGDTETGVALQKLVLKLDAGEVLGTRRMPLTDDLDATVVHERLAHMGASLLQFEFMDYLRGNLVGLAQDEAAVTYARKIEKSEGEIQWSGRAREIFNVFRGLTLGPGSWTTLAGRKIKVFTMHLLESYDIEGHAPGEVLSTEKNAIIVACGHGAVSIAEVQAESRNRQSVTDFLRGHKLQPGERFGT